MNMKIERKEGFQVIGFSEEIRPEEGYKKCPEFWDREYNEKYSHLWQTMKPENDEEQAILDNQIGALALCIHEETSVDDFFEYMIGGIYRGGKVPTGMKLYDFPESDWIVFETKGPLPTSLQQLNTYIWETWYPAEGDKYIQKGKATVEFYTPGDPASHEYVCGMWIPVIKK